ETKPNGCPSHSAKRVGRWVTHMSTSIKPRNASISGCRDIRKTSRGSFLTSLSYACLTGSRVLQIYVGSRVLTTPSAPPRVPPLLWQEGSASVFPSSHEKGCRRSQRKAL